MQDKDRTRRRTKRAEKRKKERANVSRPGTGGPIQASSAAKGRTWPPGECYASNDWEEPGAGVDLVFSRSRSDGSTVTASFTIDRSGPGLVSARAIGGMRREHVASECVRLSEDSGRTLVGCAPGLVAALVDDAQANGANPAPRGFRDAYELLEGVERMELPVPFGFPTVAEEAPQEKPQGLLQRWFSS